MPLNKETKPIFVVVCVSNPFLLSDNFKQHFLKGFDFIKKKWYSYLIGQCKSEYGLKISTMTYSFLKDRKSLINYAGHFSIPKCLLIYNRICLSNRTWSDERKQSQTDVTQIIPQQLTCNSCLFSYNTCRFTASSEKPFENA